MNLVKGKRINSLFKCLCILLFVSSYSFAHGFSPSSQEEPQEDRTETSESDLVSSPSSWSPWPVNMTNLSNLTASLMQHARSLGTANNSITHYIQSTFNLFKKPKPRSKERQKESQLQLQLQSDSELQPESETEFSTLDDFFSFPNKFKREIDIDRGVGIPGAIVIGARLKYEASAATWQVANYAANTQSNSSSSAHRRQRRNILQKLKFWKSGKPNHHNHPPPPPPQDLAHAHSHHHVQYRKPGKHRRHSKLPMMTMTQRRFSEINRSYRNARRFQRTVMKDHVLSLSVVLNPNGVRCKDVCDPDGPGYGLLGFCTSNFCRCDFGDWDFYEKNCPHNLVFDPVKLTCDTPASTVLCADLPPAPQEFMDFGSHISHSNNYAVVQKAPDGFNQNPQNQNQQTSNSNLTPANPNSHPNSISSVIAQSTNNNKPNYVPTYSHGSNSNSPVPNSNSIPHTFLVPPTPTLRQGQGQGQAPAPGPNNALPFNNINSNNFGAGFQQSTMPNNNNNNNNHLGNGNQMAQASMNLNSAALIQNQNQNLVQSQNSIPNQMQSSNGIFMITAAPSIVQAQYMAPTTYHPKIQYQNFPLNSMSNQVQNQNQNFNGNGNGNQMQMNYAQIQSQTQNQIQNQQLNRPILPPSPSQPSQQNNNGFWSGQVQGQVQGQSQGQSQGQRQLNQNQNAQIIFTPNQNNNNQNFAQNPVQNNNNQFQLQMSQQPIQNLNSNYNQQLSVRQLETQQNPNFGVPVYPQQPSFETQQQQLQQNQNTNVQNTINNNINNPVASGSNNLEMSYPQATSYQMSMNQWIPQSRQYSSDNSNTNLNQNYQYNKQSYQQQQQPESGSDYSEVNTGNGNSPNSPNRIYQSYPTSASSSVSMSSPQLMSTSMLVSSPSQTYSLRDTTRDPQALYENVAVSTYNSSNYQSPGPSGGSGSGTSTSENGDPPSYSVVAQAPPGSEYSSVVHHYYDEYPGNSNSNPNSNPNEIGTQN